MTRFVRRADARASVKLGREERAVRATEVKGSERDRLWQLVCAEFPLYATYQRQVARPGRIPRGATARTNDHQPLAVLERVERHLAWLRARSSRGGELDL